jgi:hypothetical protein
MEPPDVIHFEKGIDDQFQLACRACWREAIVPHADRVELAIELAEVSGNVERASRGVDYRRGKPLQAEKASLEIGERIGARNAGERTVEASPV